MFSSVTLRLFWAFLYCFGIFSYINAQQSPPSVLLYAPSNGATGVYLQENMIISFSQSMEFVPGSVGKVKTVISSSSVVWEEWSCNDPTITIQGSQITFMSQVERKELVKYSVLIDSNCFRSVATAVPFGGIAGVNTWTFTTGKFSPPTPTSFTPEVGATNVDGRKQLNIVFNSVVRAMAGSTSRVSIKSSDGSTLCTIDCKDGTGFSGSGTNTLSLSCPTKLTDDTAVTVTIPYLCISDEYHNIAATINTWTFTTGDYTVPTITSTVPQNLAFGVPRTQVVSLVFSETVVVNSASKGSMSIRRSSDNSVVHSIKPADISITSRTLEINPPTALWPDGTRLEVLIDNDLLHDTNNNYFSVSGPSLIFTTIDLTSPSIVSTNPANLAVNTAVQGDLVMVFNENVVKGMVSGYFTIKRVLNDATITRIALFSSSVVGWGSNTIKISPPIILPDATAVYITVDSGVIIDLAQNPFPGIVDKTTWTFTTGDFTPPQVVSLTPSVFHTNVSPETLLEVEFHEDVILSDNPNANIFIRGTDSSYEVTIPLTTVNGNGTSTLSIPHDPLPEQTKMRVVIGSGLIFDSVRNVFPGMGPNSAVDWVFTTGKFTAPVVKTFTPAHKSREKAVSSKIIWVFSENVRVGTGSIQISKFDWEYNFRIDEDTPTSLFSLDITDSSVAVLDPPNTLTLTLPSSLPTDAVISVLPSPGVVTDLTPNKNPFKGWTSYTTYMFATTDTLPPLAVTLTPTNNTAGVPVKQALTLLFNEPISLTSGSIHIRNLASGASIVSIPTTSAAITNNADIYTLTINMANTPLPLDTRVYVDLAAGVITDKAGNPFPGFDTSVAHRWMWRTADISPPVIVSSSPAHKSIIAPIDQDIILTFNKPIYFNPLDNPDGAVLSFSLHTLSDNAVVQTWTQFTGTISGVGVLGDGSESTKATLSLDNPLLYETQYYLLASKGVVIDVSKNPFGGLLVSSTLQFRTLDITDPSLIATSPLTNALLVPVTSSIRLFFDEPVMLQPESASVTDGSDEIRLMKASTYNNNDPDPNHGVAAVCDTLVLTIARNSIIGDKTDSLTILQSASSPLSSKLQSLTKYCVIVGPAAITDISGNKFAGLGVDSIDEYYFITRNDNPVFISSSLPAHAETGVPLNTKTTSFTFNKAVSVFDGRFTLRNIDLSVDVATITITNSRTKPVINVLPADLVVGISGNETETLVIDWGISGLETFTRFAVIISNSVVKDEYGAGYRGLNLNTASGYEYYFTSFDNIPPSVIGTSPFNTTTTAEINGPITFIFSKPIKLDLSSLSPSTTPSALNSMVIHLTSDDSVVEIVPLFIDDLGVIAPNPDITITSSTGSPPVTDSILTVSISSTLKILTPYYISLPPNLIVDANNNLFKGLGINDGSGKGVVSDSYKTDFFFSTGDLSIPELVWDSLIPSVASISVPTKTDIIMVFNKNIAVVAGNNKFLTLYRGDTTSSEKVVEFNLNDKTKVSVATNTVTIRGITLSPLEKYYILVTPDSIRDRNNWLFAGVTSPTEWYFTTLDDIPPYIVTHDPPHASTGVANGGTVTLTFSEEIVIKSDASISMYKYDGDVLITTITETDITLSSDKLTLSFTPSTFPSATTVYFAISNTAFSDTHGNYFAGLVSPSSTTTVSKTYYFTVTDYEPPLLLSHLPLHQAVDVDGRKLRLFLEFNEPVSSGAGEVCIYGKRVVPPTEPYIYSDDVLPEPIEIEEDKEALSSEDNPNEFNPSSLASPFSLSALPPGIDYKLCVPAARALFTQSNTVDLPLPESLPDLMHYYVTIDSTAFKDYSDNFFLGFDAVDKWEFETGDFTPPQIVTAFPSVGGNNGNNSPFTLKFNENIYLNSTAGENGDKTVRIWRHSSFADSLPHTVTISNHGLIAEPKLIATLPLATSVAVTGNTLSIKHVALDAFTVYSVQFSAWSIRDNTGNHFDNFIVSSNYVKNGNSGTFTLDSTVISQDRIWWFMIGDLTPPSLIATIPVLDDRSVGALPTFTLTFGEDILIKPSAQTKFNIHESNSGVVVGTVDAESPEVTPVYHSVDSENFGSPLISNVDFDLRYSTYYYDAAASYSSVNIVSPISLKDRTKYYISMSSAFLTDRNLNPFAGIANDATKWHFTTKDNTPPLLLSSTPAHQDPAGSTSEMKLVFNEIVVIKLSGDPNLDVITLVHPATNQRVVVPLYPVSNTDPDSGTSSETSYVSGTGTTTLKITYPSLLLEGKEYYVLINNNNICDPDGNCFAGFSTDTEYTFTTGYFLPPELLSLSPPHKAINVPLQTTLVMKFATPVYPTESAAGEGGITVQSMYSKKILFVLNTQSSDSTVTSITTPASTSAGGGVITGLGSTTITITVDGSFPDGERVSVVVKLGAMVGVHKNKVAAFELGDWQFSVVDTVPPYAVTYKAGVADTNAYSHNVDVNYYITFNEFVSVGSTGSVVIYRTHADSSSANVLAVVGCAELKVVDDITVAIPMPLLEDFSDYHITLSPLCVTDLSGNSFPGIVTLDSANPPVDVTNPNGVTIPSYNHWHFTTGDNTNPLLISSIPADKAIQIPITTTFTFEFSETVKKPGSLFSGVLELYEVGINNRPYGESEVDKIMQTSSIPSSDARVTISGTTATVTLTANTLKDSRLYCVYLSRGFVVDTNNNPYINPLEEESKSDSDSDSDSDVNTENHEYCIITFHTTDLLPPSLLETDPINDTLRAPTTQILTLTFDEPVIFSNSGQLSFIDLSAGGVSLAVIDFTLIDLSDTSGNNPHGVVLSGSGTPTVTIKTDVHIDEYTLVKVLLSTPLSPIKDVAGNSFAGFPYVYSYTIADTTPPRLFLTHPPHLQPYASLDTDINITFNEPIVLSLIDQIIANLPSDSTIDLNEQKKEKLYEALSMCVFIYLNKKVSDVSSVTPSTLPALISASTTKYTICPHLGRDATVSGSTLTLRVPAVLPHSTVVAVVIQDKVLTDLSENYFPGLGLSLDTDFYVFQTNFPLDLAYTFPYQIAIQDGSKMLTNTLVKPRYPSSGTVLSCTTSILAYSKTPPSPSPTDSEPISPDSSVLLALNGLTFDSASGAIGGYPKFAATYTLLVSCENSITPIRGQTTVNLSIVNYKPAPVYYKVLPDLVDSASTHPDTGDMTLFDIDKNEVYPLLSLTAGTPMTQIRPSVMNTFNFEDNSAYSDNNQYSVDPPLPEGLTINRRTGAISGTPGFSSDRTQYRITITNSGTGLTASGSVPKCSSSGICERTGRLTVGIAIVVKPGPLRLAVDASLLTFQAQSSSPSSNSNTNTNTNTSNDGNTESLLKSLKEQVNTATGRSDIVLVPLNLSDMHEALARGEVDLIVSSHTDAVLNYYTYKHIIIGHTLVTGSSAPSALLKPVVLVRNSLSSLSALSSHVKNNANNGILCVASPTGPEVLALSTLLQQSSGSAPSALTRTQYKSLYSETGGTVTVSDFTIGNTHIHSVFSSTLYGCTSPIITTLEAVSKLSVIPADKFSSARYRHSSVTQVKGLGDSSTSGPDRAGYFTGKTSPFGTYTHSHSPSRCPVELTSTYTPSDSRSASSTCAGVSNGIHASLLQSLAAGRCDAVVTYQHLVTHYCTSPNSNSSDSNSSSTPSWCERLETETQDAPETSQLPSFPTFALVTRSSLPSDTLEQLTTIFNSLKSLSSFHNILCEGCVGATITASPLPSGTDNAVSLQSVKEAHIQGQRPLTFPLLSSPSLSPTGYHQHTITYLSPYLSHVYSMPGFLNTVACAYQGVCVSGGLDVVISRTGVIQNIHLPDSSSPSTSSTDSYLPAYSSQTSSSQSPLPPPAIRLLLNYPPLTCSSTSLSLLASPSVRLASVHPVNQVSKVQDVLDVVLSAGGLMADTVFLVNNVPIQNNFQKSNDLVSALPCQLPSALSTSPSSLHTTKIHTSSISTNIMSTLATPQPHLLPSSLSALFRGQTDLLIVDGTRALLAAQLFNSEIVGVEVESEAISLMTQKYRPGLIDAIHQQGDAFQASSAPQPTGDLPNSYSSLLSASYLSLSADSAISKLASTSYVVVTATSGSLTRNQLHNSRVCFGSSTDALHIIGYLNKTDSTTTSQPSHQEGVLGSLLASVRGSFASVCAPPDDDDTVGICDLCFSEPTLSTHLYYPSNNASSVITGTGIFKTTQSTQPSLQSSPSSSSSSSSFSSSVQSSHHSTSTSTSSSSSSSFSPTSISSPSLSSSNTSPVQGCSRFNRYASDAGALLGLSQGACNVAIVRRHSVLSTCSRSWTQTSSSRGGVWKSEALKDSELTAKYATDNTPTSPSFPSLSSSQRRNLDVCMNDRSLLMTSLTLYSPKAVDIVKNVVIRNPQANSFSNSNNAANLVNLLNMRGSAISPLLGNSPDMTANKLFLCSGDCDRLSFHRNMLARLQLSSSLNFNTLCQSGSSPSTVNRQCLTSAANTFFNPKYNICKDCVKP